MVAEAAGDGPPADDGDAEDGEVDCDGEPRVIVEAEKRECIEGDGTRDNEQADPRCRPSLPPLVGEVPPTAADALVLGGLCLRDS